MSASTETTCVGPAMSRSSSVPPLSGTYYVEDCGICEKEGADVLWYNPKSKSAHKECLKKIEAAEGCVKKAIAEFFKVTQEDSITTLAHTVAIRAVRTALGPDTILSYLEKHGETALSTLFSKKGEEAVRLHALDEWYRHHTR